MIVKEIYTSLLARYPQDESSHLFWPYWHRHIPTKILLFGLLVWKRRVLTWDALMHRGFQGPGWCILCRNHEESVDHLFFTCSVDVQIWKLFSPLLGESPGVPVDFMDGVNRWDKLRNKYQSLPFFLIWEIWKMRNRIIFEDGLFSIHAIHNAIMKWIYL